MAAIFAGRYTAQTDEPLVVFLIGMRINRLWAIHKWFPTLWAMPSMLITLARYPQKGLLGSHTILYSGGIGVIQYWRSFEDLEHFARNQDDPHLASWRRFNRSVGNDGSVGIWHETYLVEPGRFESIYVNMPAFGLAAATTHQSLKEGSRSRQRLAEGATKHGSMTSSQP